MFKSTTHLFLQYFSPVTGSHLADICVVWVENLNAYVVTLFEYGNKIVTSANFEGWLGVVSFLLKLEEVPKEKEIFLAKAKSILEIN